MEINPLILFVGGLGVLFFGYFFGLFEGRGQGRKRALAEFSQKEKEEAIERAVPPAPPAAAAAPDEPGLLRLKEGDAGLRLELDGTPMEAEDLSPQQRRRLIEVVTRMRPWLEPRQPAPAAPPAPFRAESVPQRPAGAAATPVASAAIPVEQTTPTPSSMIAQIDDILQKNIAGGPLAGRGIRIQDAPGGGVVVLVGMQRYSAVSDVPDPEVQAVLRAAIAAWEQKYTPGV